MDPNEFANRILRQYYAQQLAAGAALSQITGGAALPPLGVAPAALPPSLLPLLSLPTSQPASLRRMALPQGAGVPLPIETERLLHLARLTTPSPLLSATPAATLSSAAAATLLPSNSLVLAPPPAYEAARIPIASAAAELPKEDDSEHGRKLYQTWRAMFERLLKYKRKHGDCLVPHRCKEDPKLGRWVERQRRNKKKKTLNASRIQILNDVGFEWSVRDKGLWDTMFARLQDYKERTGDCLVPTKYPLDPKLGNWVQTQRQSKDSLTPERLQRLESIDFVWCLRETWDGMFERLQQFKNEHGHCNVPTDYRQDSKLAQWVSVQRTRENKLSIKRKERLDSIDFEWH